jgi:hypothetical protein
MNKLKQKIKSVQLTLTIDGVTMIKTNVQPNGEFYGMHYVLPPRFNYENLQLWKEKNAIEINKFRKN